MANYKLYFLNLLGAIQVRVDLDCAGDEKAIVAAQGAADDRAMELWDGSRFVAKFDRKGERGAQLTSVATRRDLDTQRPST